MVDMGISWALGASRSLRGFWKDLESLLNCILNTSWRMSCM